MPEQNCDTIKVTYKLIGEDAVTVEVESSGVANGKNYYRFNISGFSQLFTVIWNGTSWVIWKNESTQATLSGDTPCPFGTYTIEEGSIFEAFVVHPVINNPYAESINCYKLLVWKKQCEFSKCVLKYLRNLQFGIFNCNELEHLKNKRRVLNILNSYDARDILYNTTEYNTITYAEIQELLNY